MKNLVFSFSILFFSYVSLANVNGAMTDKNVRYLDASQFPNLPTNVKKVIEEKKCQVPQTFLSKAAHNVVKGNFANEKSNDWAILCSNGKKSSILVVWENGMPCPSEFAIKEDKDFLQKINEKEIQYSRYLSSASKETIKDHQKAYGGILPQKIDHQGIDDAIAEKASVTFYCEKGKWLSLTGAD